MGGGMDPGHHHGHDAAVGRTPEPVLLDGARGDPVLWRHWLVRRLPEGLRPELARTRRTLDVPLAVAGRHDRGGRALPGGHYASGDEPLRPVLQGRGHSPRDRLRRADLPHGRRHEQRREPDRRSRRTRHPAHRHGEFGAGVHRLPRRPRRVRELPADTLCSRRRRARGLLRRHHRRGPRLPVVQRLPRPGDHGRHRGAGARRRTRPRGHHHPARSPSCSSWAACSSSRSYPSSSR